MRVCVYVCVYNICIYMRKQECVNKDYAKNTETLKNRNEHMNVHINCRPRNLRNQGAQCARPKVRNVRSPRCAM